MSILDNRQMRAYLRNDNESIKQEVDRAFGLLPRQQAGTP